MAAMALKRISHRTHGIIGILHCRDIRSAVVRSAGQWE